MDGMDRMDGMDVMVVMVVMAGAGKREFRETPWTNGGCDANTSGREAPGGK